MMEPAKRASVLSRAGVLLCLFAVLVASSSADQAASYAGYSQNDPASYSFSWSVLDSYSGNDYGHSENRQGHDTSGQYYVHLPDGRVQTVTYNVDPYSGYQAKVLYEGAKQPYSPPPAKTPYQAAAKAPYKAPKAAPYNPKAAPSYTSSLTFVPSPRKAPYVPPAPAPAKYAPGPTYRPVHQPQPASYHPPSQPLYKPVTPGPSYRFGGVKPVSAPLRSAKSGNSLSLHKPSHSPLKGHDHDPYLKSEAELLGKDFSNPFFYEYKSKLSTKGKLKKVKAGQRF